MTSNSPILLTMLAVVAAAFWYDASMTTAATPDASNRTADVR
jgi:hypothetical protein